MTSQSKPHAQRPRSVLMLFAAHRFLQTHFMAWVHALQAGGMHVHVGTALPAYLKKMPPPGYHDLPFQRAGLNPLKALHEIWTILKLLGKTTPEVLHLFGWRMILFGLLASLMHPRTKVICFVTGMGSVFLQKGFIQRHCTSGFLLILRCLFFLKKPALWMENQPDLTFLATRLSVPLSRQKCVPGAGVDAQHFAIQPFPEMGLLTLGYCGRFIKDKGLGELVTAIAQINQDGIKVRLHLGGTGDPQSLSAFSDAQITAWGKIPGITLFGHQSYEQLPGFWGAVHGAILPSYSEGLPKMLVEASLSGRGAIATAVSGCQAVVDDPETGTLVPPHNVPALVQSITSWIEDPQAAKHKGLAAHKKATATFSLTQVTAFLQKAYGLEPRLASHFESPL